MPKLIETFKCHVCGQVKEYNKSNYRQFVKGISQSSNKKQCRQCFMLKQKIKRKTGLKISFLKTLDISSLKKLDKEKVKKTIIKKQKSDFLLKRKKLNTEEKMYFSDYLFFKSRNYTKEETIKKISQKYFLNNEWITNLVNDKFLIDVANFSK